MSLKTLRVPTRWGATNTSNLVVVVVVVVVVVMVHGYKGEYRSSNKFTVLSHR